MANNIKGMMLTGLQDMLKDLKKRGVKMPSDDEDDSDVQSGEIKDDDGKTVGGFLKKETTVPLGKLTFKGPDEDDEDDDSDQDFKGPDEDEDHQSLVSKFLGPDDEEEDWKDDGHDEDNTEHEDTDDADDADEYDDKMERLKRDFPEVYKKVFG